MVPILVLLALTLLGAVAGLAIICLMEKFWPRLKKHVPVFFVECPKDG